MSGPIDTSSDTPSGLFSASPGTRRFYGVLTGLAALLTAGAVALTVAAALGGAHASELVVFAGLDLGFAGLTAVTASRVAERVRIEGTNLEARVIRSWSVDLREVTSWSLVRTHANEHGTRPDTLLLRTERVTRRIPLWNLERPSELVQRIESVCGPPAS